MRNIWSLLGLALFSSCNVPLTVGEAARVSSPSGQIDAIVIEAGTGPRASSSYDIFVVPAGATHTSGVHVASLFAATRNQNAQGVTLKWGGPEELRIEYLKADAAEVLRKEVAIEGQQVRVLLREGVDDPAAPAGRMLENRGKKVGGS